jgi:hypothetical protein
VRAVTALADYFDRERIDPATVSADDFLAEIFAGIPGRVMLCRPNMRTGGYQQQFWRPGLCATLPPDAWLFAIATVNGLADGMVRRRYEDLRRHACIVLDDVGTKIDRDRITLPPSWVLKTSVKLWDRAARKEAPDGEPVANMQIGYVIDAGMDPGSARLLLKALADNKVTDEGATAATQPFRLPGSLNFKHDPPFAARLVVWEPSARYLPSEIARHYNLGPKPKPAEPRPITRRFDNDDDPVWRALQLGRHLLSDQPRNGWYAIRCPWQDEHHNHSLDGKPDSGIAYKPRHAGLGAAFKCFHGSCASRGWRDLHDLLVRS